MKRALQSLWRAGVLFALVVLAGPAHATPFDINVSFDGGLTQSQQAVFNQAEIIWESLITGYQPGISITSLNITASGAYVDGVGGTLGQAGPTYGVQQGGFILATRGIMQFDSADLAVMEVNGILLNVITHEMAHVMGFGTLWEYNGVYVGDTGQYTGANALAAYQAEFDPAAASVPVELGGGIGTANAHWDEVDGGVGDGDDGLTGITNSQGQDMAYELMTGWIDGAGGQPAFISNTTVQSFGDIGYVAGMPANTEYVASVPVTTEYVASVSAPVPEPATVWLLGIGLAGISLFTPRRRRFMAQAASRRKRR